MKRQATAIFWIITLTLVLLVGQINLNSIMAGNESPDAFDESASTTSDPESITASTPTPLNKLIIEGGGSFLQSSSNFDAFTSKYELSEIYGANFKAFQDSLNAAIDDMKKTQSTYWKLKERAAITPYKYKVIYKLYSFDYWSFQEKRSLNPVIFEKVQLYLMFGDVRGVYSEFYSQTSEILKDIQAVKTVVDAEIMPNVSDLWRINQKYAEFKLYAQYVAEVFYSL